MPSSHTSQPKPEAPRVGRLPVVFHEADVVLQRVHAQGLHALQVELLNVGGGGFEQHLVLIVVLETVGVIPVAPVGGPPGWLDVSHIPRLGSQRFQGGVVVKGSGAYFQIIGLNHHATLAAPKPIQRENDILKIHVRFLDCPYR